LLHPIQAVGHLLQLLLQFEARGGKRCPAVIGDRAAHGRTIALHDGRFRIVPLLHGPFDPADAAHLLLELFLGMPVGLEDRMRRLAQEMELAQLMRHARQDLGDRLADGGLTVADHAHDRHAHGGHGLAQQPRQILGPAGEQAAGQHDDAGRAVADDPQHLMANIRLHSVQRQNDPPLLGQELLQRAALHQPGGEQLVIAVEQIGDAALGDGDAPGGEHRVDLGHAAMLAVAQGPDEGDDVQAELVLGQGQGALTLRPVRLVEAGAVERLAPADLETQADRAGQRHKGAMVLVADAHRGSAGRAKPTGGTQHPLALRRQAP
jgi:hypothetical protein